MVEPVLTDAQMLAAVADIAKIEEACRRAIASGKFDDGQVAILKTVLNKCPDARESFALNVKHIKDSMELLHCHKWCGGTEDRDYFATPDACWKYYTANRWHILCFFRCYRRLVDWKDGGSIELACMSEVEKAAFFDYARDCGMWDWTKAEECHCDRACIGELSGTRRLGGAS